METEKNIEPDLKVLVVLGEMVKLKSSDEI